MHLIFNENTINKDIIMYGMVVWVANSLYYGEINFHGTHSSTLSLRYLSTAISMLVPM